MSKLSYYSLILLAMLIGGCRVISVDPFVAAQRSLKHGNLLDTLLSLDQVPPSHPRYMDARSVAHAVERRMRTAHKLLSRGMAFRAEWRDEEAIDMFEQALAVWGHVSTARELISSTKHRVTAMQPNAPTASVDEDLEVVETSPIGLPAPGPGGESQAVSTEDSDPLIENARPDVSPGISTRLHVAAGLLNRGKLERALDLLEGMHAELPNHPQVARSLVRVLNQRALLHYGQGDLELALSDWTRVLRLDGSHGQARGFLIAAQAELKSISR